MVNVPVRDLVVKEDGHIRPLTYYGGKGLDVRTVSGEFLLSLQKLWREQVKQQRPSRRRSRWRRTRSVLGLTEWGAMMLLALLMVTWIPLACCRIHTLLRADVTAFRRAKMALARQRLH